MQEQKSGGAEDLPNSARRSAESSLQKPQGFPEPYKSDSILMRDSAWAYDPHIEPMYSTRTDISAKRRKLGPRVGLPIEVKTRALRQGSDFPPEAPQTVQSIWSHFKQPRPDADPAAAGIITYTPSQTQILSGRREIKYTAGHTSAPHQPSYRPLAQAQVRRPLRDALPPETPHMPGPRQNVERGPELVRPSIHNPPENYPHYGLYRRKREAPLDLHQGPSLIPPHAQAIEHRRYDPRYFHGAEVPQAEQNLPSQSLRSIGVLSSARLTHLKQGPRRAREYSEVPPVSAHRSEYRQERFFEPDRPAYQPRGHPWTGVPMQIHSQGRDGQRLTYLHPRSIPGKREMYPSLPTAREALSVPQRLPGLHPVSGELGRIRKSEQPELFRRVQIMNKETGRRKTKYFCLFCNREFQSSSNVKSHIRSHTGEKPYVCDICGARYSQLTNIKRHKKQAHPEEGNT